MAWSRQACAENYEGVRASLGRLLRANAEGQLEFAHPQLLRPVVVAGGGFFGSSPRRRPPPSESRSTKSSEEVQTLLSSSDVEAGSAAAGAEEILDNGGADDTGAVLWPCAVHLARHVLDKLEVCGDCSALEKNSLRSPSNTSFGSPAIISGAKKINSPGDFSGFGEEDDLLQVLAASPSTTACGSAILSSEEEDEAEQSDGGCHEGEKEDLLRVPSTTAALPSESRTVLISPSIATQYNLNQEKNASTSSPREEDSTSSPREENVSSASSRRQLRVVELGCGTALCSLACALDRRRRFRSVVATDLCVASARRALTLNGYFSDSSCGSYYFRRACHEEERRP